MYLDQGTKSKAKGDVKSLGRSETREKWLPIKFCSSLPSTKLNQTCKVRVIYTSIPEKEIEKLKEKASKEILSSGK